MNSGKKDGPKGCQKLHIRRCHLCGGISENEGSAVTKCGHCGKSMAPFYFFDDTEVIPFSDDVECELEAPKYAGERKPVRGFTAYW
jgi:hypothetical protein